MKINKKVLHFGLIMAEILILSICIYRTSKPEEFSQIFPYKSLESEEGLYLDSIGGEGGCYVDNSMDSRENCIRTPQILLAKGSYEISIRYDTVVNDQSYSFRSQNPTYRVLSGRERQPLEGNRKDIVLHVNYGEAVNGFQIQFNYSGNGYLAIHNVEITKTKEREKQQSFNSPFCCFDY